MDNIVNTPASGNTPQEPMGAPSEIDMVFGDVDPNEGIDGSMSSGSQGEPASEPASKDDNDEFTGLNAEEVIKKLQSTKDKYRTQLDMTSKKLEQLQPLEQFLTQIYEDEEVRRAFISELEPDLIKPKDPYSVLQEQIAKEFGADFNPDDEEAKKPFTTSWRYFRRVEELLKSANETKSVPKSLKELKEERKKQREASQQQAEQEKLKVLSTMKWQDEQYNHFASWVGKLSGTDLAKIYTYTLRKQGKAPNLVNQSGGTSYTPNAQIAELNKFFG